MYKQEKIRKEILKKTACFFGLREKEKFIPGKSTIAYAGRVYDQDDLVNLVDASLDFWLTSGRFAKQFENEFAKFLGVKYALLTNSGSSANLLAVTALTSPLLGRRRLKPGDEVITTACGFPTTVNPVIQNNLIPVFVDVQLGTYNIDPDKLKKTITAKTKAIFTAHTLGNPVNIAAVKELAKKHKLWWIEDNCDALGSKYGSGYTGTFGDISTSSFYPPHHITMGEGGAVLTSDALLRKIIISLRDWGRDCWCEPGRDSTCGMRFKGKFGGLPEGYDHKYIYSHIGYNLKVTDMQAAVGCSQLKKLPGFIRQRRENFQYLYRRLSGYKWALCLPQAEPGSRPSWFGFPVLVKEGAPFSRAELVKYLEGSHIATRMLFGGNLTKQPAYRNVKYRVFGTLKNTDLVMNGLFWIGVYPGLRSEHLEYISRTFAQFFKRF